MMKKNGSKGPGGPGGPRAMIREKPKNIRATLGKLLKYIGKNKYSVILIIVTTIITTLLNLLGPTLQGKAIDAITITEQRLSVDFDGLVRNTSAHGSRLPRKHRHTDSAGNRVG